MAPEAFNLNRSGYGKWSLYQYAKLREPPTPPPDASERERQQTLTQLVAQGSAREIGRASCRERVFVGV